MSDARTGLYGGKFAPFHRGHQFVTELALKEVDHLIIIVYSCDVIDIPVNVRANWIRKLYPEVNVIEAWSTPEGDPNDPKNEQAHVDYIKKLIGSHKITHFYSSERYGEYVSKALSCIDRRVDMSRTNVPICATKIRENVFEYREYLSPVVYRDFITKVAFIGSMSCGKTTITEVLGRKHHTTWALEFGREYWNQHHVDRQLPPEGFDEICRGQIALEDAALINANKYFFGDTCAITAYMFTLEFNGVATDYLKQMALENPQRYDLYFVCGDEEEEMVTITDVIVEYDEHYSLVTLTDTERDSVQSAKEKTASESSSESIQSLRTEKKKEEEVEDKKKEKEEEEKKEDNDSYEYYSSDDQKDDKKDDQKDDQNDDKKDDKVSDSETSYSYTETEVTAKPEPKPIEKDSDSSYYYSDEEPKKSPQAAEEKKKEEDKKQESEGEYYSSEKPESVTPIPSPKSPQSVGRSSSSSRAKKGSDKSYSYEYYSDDPGPSPAASISKEGDSLAMTSHANTEPIFDAEDVGEAPAPAPVAQVPPPDSSDDDSPFLMTYVTTHTESEDSNDEM